MEYRRCGKSGLMLPAVSLGLWHNFGKEADFETCRDILTAAFDSGVTHFDLANNYGPPPGAAEETFGKVLAADFKVYRDEMIISPRRATTCGRGLTVSGEARNTLSPASTKALRGWALNT